MFFYIVKRFAQLVPVLIGATLILFFLLYIIPGDPVRVLSGEKSPTPQQLVNIRHKYHLDKPFYEQYGYYVLSLSRGDFGTSYRYKRPVMDILKEHYPNSIKLAFSAIIIEIIIGIIAGLISAVKRYSFIDILLTFSSSIAVCVPVFWLGVLFQINFGLNLKWFPISGMGDGSLKYYVLPSLTLASVSTAYVARMMRSSVLEVLRQDYIVAAAAKGLSKFKVISKHVLKNALIPVVTLIGMDLGSLMGGAILTETVFNWPGIGRQIYLAITARDIPVVMGGTFILILIFILINLIVDISYAFFDPRIRYSGAGGKEVR